MSTILAPFRLVVIDDHPIVRHSFNIICESITDIKVVGSFGRSTELFSWLSEHECDVLVLDYVLEASELDGLSLIKLLLERYPDLNILLLSSMESLAVIRTAFILGVKGYIAKREEAATFLLAVRTVASGQRYIPEHIAVELAQVPQRKRDAKRMKGLLDLDRVALNQLLTTREAEVIECFLGGMTIIDIAVKLKRSRKTVSGHKQTALKKLGITSDLELFKYREDLFN